MNMGIFCSMVCTKLLPTNSNVDFSYFNDMNVCNQRKRVISTHKSTKLQTNLPKIINIHAYYEKTFFALTQCILHANISNALHSANYITYNILK